MTIVFADFWSQVSFKPSKLLLVPISGLAYLLYVTQIEPLFSSWRNIPGPKGDGWIRGSLKFIRESPPGVAHGTFIKEFGPSYKYTTWFGIERFYTIDPYAINHVLRAAYMYPKPERIRQGLAQLLGILFAEDEPHKRQRRLLLPAFSPQSIKDLTPLFLEKGYELAEKINSLSTEGVSSLQGVKEPTIDIMFWIGRATLDVIGAAGFDYQFDALKHEDNELSKSFNDTFASARSLAPMLVFPWLAPLFRLLPSQRERSNRFARSLVIMNRIGDEIVEKKKKEILSGVDKVEKSDLAGHKDLLTILMRSNLAEDLPESQRMSDEEIKGQISTFLLAGFETSSTALSWTIYSLCEDPSIQKKLREELLTLKETDPSLDALNSLPYLEAVIKESLRLNSPVAASVRTALADDEIPLKYPVTGNDGHLITSVRIKKGDTVFLPILTYNSAEVFWGEDAMEFKPERWLSPLPVSTTDLEVPFAHIQTFLGGVRGCIGYRFALAEIKAILFVLIRSFTFEFSDPKPEFERKSALVMRPYVKGMRLLLLLQSVIRQIC